MVLNSLFKRKFYFRGMKAKAYSFLFFFLLIYAHTFGQVIQETDSARYYYFKISKPTNFSDFKKASTFFEKKVRSSLDNQDTLKAIQNLRLIAYGQTEYGFLNDSEQTAVYALRLAEHVSSKKSSSLYLGLYNQLGMIYRRLQDYDTALSYYNKALIFSQSKKDSINLLNNKATIYKDLEQYGLAKESLEKTLNILPKEDYNKQQYARVLANLGYVQFKLGNKESLSNLKKALRYRIEENDLAGQYSSYNELTEYYIEHKNYPQARLFFDKGYAVAKQINSPEYLVNALGKYVLLNKDPKIIEFKKLKDSLEEARQIKENNYAAMKYDVEKEKEQTHLALLQQEQEKRKKNIYFFVLLILILISASIIYTILQKRKQRQLQTIQQTEASISKKIHDGLANDTFQILSELQNLEDIPEHILIKLDKIYLETRDIAKNHSPLLEGADFEDQLISRLNSYRSDQLNVITRNVEKIEWQSFNKNKKDTIYMVLGELMTNNKKHSQATLAFISFEQNGKKLRITYQDNGIGSPLKKGNGMQNMESRMNAMNGTINFESALNKGLKVQIQI